MSTDLAPALPSRLRAHALPAADLAAASDAVLRETRADLLAGIERAEPSSRAGGFRARDTLTVHRHNLAAVEAELARRASTPPVEPAPHGIAPALLDALAALQVRVDTARASLDEATRHLHDEEVGRNDPDVVADLRAARHRAWARLTEAQDCLATVERFR